MNPCCEDSGSSGYNGGVISNAEIEDATQQGPMCRIQCVHRQPVGFVHEPYAVPIVAVPDRRTCASSRPGTRGVSRGPESAKRRRSACVSRGGVGGRWSFREGFSDYVLTRSASSNGTASHGSSGKFPGDCPSSNPGSSLTETGSNCSDCPPSRISSNS